MWSSWEKKSKTKNCILKMQLFVATLKVSSGVVLVLGIILKPSGAFCKPSGRQLGVVLRLSWGQFGVILGGKNSTKSCTLKMQLFVAIFKGSSGVILGLGFVGSFSQPAKPSSQPSQPPSQPANRASLAANPASQPANQPTQPASKPSRPSIHPNPTSCTSNLPTS